MTNKVILALNEYMKSQSASAHEIMKKYEVTPSEFWSGYAQLKASAPK